MFSHKRMGSTGVSNDVQGFKVRGLQGGVGWSRAQGLCAHAVSYRAVKSWMLGDGRYAGMYGADVDPRTAFSA